MPDYERIKREWIGRREKRIFAAHEKQTRNETQIVSELDRITKIYTVHAERIIDALGPSLAALERDHFFITFSKSPAEELSDQIKGASTRSGYWDAEMYTLDEKVNAVLTAHQQEDEVNYAWTGMRVDLSYKELIKPVYSRRAKLKNTLVDSIFVTPIISPGGVFRECKYSGGKYDSGVFTDPKKAAEILLTYAADASEAAKKAHEEILDQFPFRSLFYMIFGIKVY